MIWVTIALGVLAAGAAGSLLCVRRKDVGLAMGLAAAGIGGVFCLIGGWTVLHGTSAMPVTVDWPLPLGSARLSVDGLSAWFLLSIGVVSIAAAIYSWGYLRTGSAHGPVGTYGSLICTIIAAMILTVCAGNVVLFLVGWELMSLSAFFLVGFHDEDPAARHGAWMYLVATHLGTAFGVLPVFAAFVARTGSTEMDTFAGAFGASETAVCAALFVLGVIGFGTKAGFMPMHIWLPAAHPVAPAPVSALMSGVVIKTGIYGLLRLISWLPDLPASCAIGLMLLSVATSIVGILYALGQRQIKRMLAYSSVENIGIIGLGISVALLGRSLQQPLLVVLGLGGALFHVLNHSLFKGLLFLSAGAVLHGTGTGDIERLGGLARRTPLNSLAFLIGAVAICALPPLNGFVSEYVIYSGLLHGLMKTPNQYAGLLASSTAALALVGGLALAAFSKVFGVVFLGNPRDETVTVHATPRSMNAGMLVLAFGCVGVAAFAGGLVPALGVAIGAVMPGAAAQLNEIQEAAIFTSRLTLPFGVLVAIAFGLFVLRQRMARGIFETNAHSTWGCGYAFPTPSMQYTGSSYGWKLVHSFRHITRPERVTPRIVECFPGPARLATDAPDLALTRVYTPFFKWVARAFESLWPLQQGRIQLYLAYIVITVLVVLAFEAWPFSSSHRNENHADSVTAGSTIGDAKGQQP